MEPEFESELPRNPQGAIQDQDRHQADSSAEDSARLDNLFEWVDCVVYSVLAVVLLLAFCFRMVGVDGTSMLETLQDGDRVIMVSLFYQPKQGDIVVLTKVSTPFIKRVIATEGQTIDIDFTLGQVYVDGVLLDEPYTREPTHRQEDMTFPQTVPKGHVFVMGDNRNHSSDSRTSMVGFVDNRYIVGHALFRVLPFRSFGKLPTARYDHS